MEVDVITKDCHRQPGYHTDPSIRPVTRDESYSVRVGVVAEIVYHSVMAVREGRLLVRGHQR